ncbi:hypothetical protein Clacol_002620 [Clathrus columnatus]|uniref:Uncharacterized protein n=1 Tax=Clathrus columnatus TaxID=1419009 RepID=A0AAV5A587_9AGAM|nr:hypothetical protein Clacol_002620 [Clathrus columnatus]
MLRPLTSLGIKREIYSRPPDWWAKYTCSAIGAENVFKRWTQEVDHPVKTEDQTVKRELRPFRQRAVLSLAIVGFGTGLGILFISGRSRIIKRMYGIFPPTVNSKKGNVAAGGEMTHLVLETFGNFSRQEKTIPKELCQTLPSKKNNELRLQVHGDSVYWIGLDNAKVDGQSTSDSTAARDKLKELLGGEKIMAQREAIRLKELERAKKEEDLAKEAQENLFAKSRA